MLRDDRLAIVVSPAASELAAEQGGLDADAMKERLLQPDTGFDVVTLDASRDIAEQLDTLFDERGETDRSVLFYASCDVRVAGDDFFLCLDPAQPDTGDALADIATVLLDRGTGQIVVVLDARYAATDDPAEGAELIATARRSLKTLESEIELVIAARPSTTDPVVSCSPFTRAILEVLDESDPASGLNAHEVYDALAGREDVLLSLRALTHLPVTDSFMIVPARGVEIDVDEGPPESITSVMDRAEDGGDEAAPRASRPDEGAAVEESYPDRLSEPTEVTEPSGLPEALPGPPLVPGARAAAEAASADEPSPEATAAPSASAPVSERAPAAPLSERPPVAASQPPPASGRGEAGPPLSFFPPPSQPDALQLIAEARDHMRKGDFDGALAIYRRALGLSNLARDVRGHVYLRMGTAKARQSKAAEAIANFEKALTLVNPEDTPRVLEELLALYLTEKDNRAALATQEKILKLLPDEAARFEALLRFGRGWLAFPEERLRARQMLERAERIQPEHRDLLVMLRELGEAEGRVEEVLGLRRRIAEVTEAPEERARLHAELGKDLAKRGREDEAVKLYEAALDAHPAALDPLAAIAEILSEKQEWSELEASYKRMLARLPRLEPAATRKAVEWELAKRLGLLLRDHFDDSKGALAAFDRATEARPTDPAARKLAADAARAVGDAEAVERHLTALAVLEPREARVYRYLFDAFMKAGEVERASDAARVLVSLGVAADRERVVVEANKPEGVPKLVHPLEETTWELLRHRDESLGPVDRIFAAAAPAVAAALAEVVATTQAGRLPPPETRVDPEGSTLSAARALALASRSVGLTPPAMYVDDRADGAYAILLADPPASKIGSTALRGRSLPELMFLAGRHVTYQTPEFRLLALCPAIEDLTACFLAAVALVTREVAGPEQMKRVIRDLMPRIEAWLGAEDLEALTTAVEAFKAEGGRADLLAYAASVERTSLRVGLLLSGDLTVATALASEGLFAGGYRDALDPEDRKSELFSYSVSRDYADLRAEVMPEAEDAREEASVAG